MTNNKHPKLNPILKELHNQGHDSNLTTVKGFIAEAPDGLVRVYPSLTASSYMDIRREDIVHFTDAEENDHPTILYVKSSAEINYTRIQASLIKAQNLQQIEERDCKCGCSDQPNTIELRRRNDTGGDWPDDYECARGCYLSLIDCLDRGESPARCLNDAQLCRIICDLIISGDNRGGRVIY